MNAHGIVHKYGDHVDTDVIIPARYLNTQSHKELAAHCMEDIDKEFIHKVKDGDIMVAGVNFGCGSSREHAPVAIKASGIRPCHSGVSRRQRRDRRRRRGDGGLRHRRDHRRY